ncbi:MAG: amidohydrolase family protein [Novosphingobium sp.]|nr:amidohydrolase family protein [Novosphingobium sp.]
MYDIVIRNGLVCDGTGTAPVRADVAIDGATIREVGKVSVSGRREIDADGLIVTPGWVDIHTHYDGQVSWDSYLSPSCWHGVTTVVMGNCGVGFAPVAGDYHDELINIMEGVEDIPGTALSEGITWEWETFREYLDFLSTREYAIDVGAQIPHAALRTYVMGERGAQNAPASEEEIARMAHLTREGLDAGAFGFTTSRICAHLTADGKIVPGTQVSVAEMDGICASLADAPGTVFEVVLDLHLDPIPGSLSTEEDLAWMGGLSRKYGVPFTFLMHQNPGNPDKWRDIMALTARENAGGANLMPQISPRPIGIIMGWQSSFNIFMGRPTYDALRDRPFREQLDELRKPETRDKILSEETGETPFAGIPLATELMFRLEGTNGKLDYEPSYEQSVKAIAEARGMSADAVIYDMLMERDGHGYVYVVVMNYGDYNLDFVRELLDDPHVLLGGSDAGAHCGAICDAAIPTFMLSYWARDRERGPRIPLEQVVARQTSHTARAYGFDDRGVIAPGMKADINVIDLERLECSAPDLLFDLPAGGRRIVQTATGYIATIKNGVVTFENGVATGALPGRLVRRKQSAHV